MGYDGTLRGYSVVGVWNPTSDNFDVLNDETPKGLLGFVFNYSSLQAPDFKLILLLQILIFAKLHEKIYKKKSFWNVE